MACFGGVLMFCFVFFVVVFKDFIFREGKGGRKRGGETTMF